MEAPWHVLDPEDPRAPSQAVWDVLTEEERRTIVDGLPSEVPLVHPPEGDTHRESKVRAFEALDEHFRRLGREVYLSSELPVYYPDESMFAPDLIAVVGVGTHPRLRWVVSDEHKGLDFVLEIHLHGNRRKDFELNVDRCARLGIPEYFAFDAGRGRLLGWRLGDHEGYVPIIPQAGRWRSEVLGLDLAIIDGRLRFFHGAAELLDARELIDQLSHMVDDAVRRAEEEERRAEEAQRRAEAEAQRAEEAQRRAESEAQRAEAEAQRADRLAARLRSLGYDPDA